MASNNIWIIGWTNVVKRIWWTFVILAVLAFFYRVRAVLTPFFFAIILAYILYPLIQWIEKKGVSKILAIVLIYSFFLLSIGVTLWFVLPNFIQEMQSVLNKLPERAKEWEELGQSTVGFVRGMKLPTSLQDLLKLVMERVELALETLTVKFLELFMGVLANVISLVIAPVLAFYFLKDHQAMRERTLRYIPAQYRSQCQRMMVEINKALNGFFRGQLLVCLFVGVFVYFGLLFLDIPYALLIGFLAGVFDIIPYFGPVLGFFLAGLFALLKGPLTILWVFLLFVAANQIENGIISPKIIGDQVGLHPLIVIFAVFVGADLMGILGMLLAVPIAAILRVILEQLLLHRRT